MRRKAQGGRAGSCNRESRDDAAAAAEAHTPITAVSPRLFVWVRHAQSHPHLPLLRRRRCPRAAA
eukprot:298974-Pleurochrysis_carterae.AAC.1